MKIATEVILGGKREVKKLTAIRKAGNMGQKEYRAERNTGLYICRDDMMKNKNLATLLIILSTMTCHST